MALQWQDFGDGSHALTNGSNIGIIIRDERALMIDAGLDRDAAKKALRGIGERGARLAGIILTHGHTDHFGGAGWAAAQSGAAVYAPAIDGAFAQTPLLEPMFLNAGAAPFHELQGKFTLARQGVETYALLEPGRRRIGDIDVDIVALPGHSPNQMGVGAGDTLFCADAVFPQATLERHPILFCTDLDAWRATLAFLPSLPYRRFVPGHGPVVEDIATAARATETRLCELRTVVLQSLSVPQEPQAVLRAAAAHFDVAFQAPEFIMLALTSIMATLTSLQRSGEAEVFVADNRLLWRRTVG